MAQTSGGNGKPTVVGLSSRSGQRWVDQLFGLLIGMEVAENDADESSFEFPKSSWWWKGQSSSASNGAPVLRRVGSDGGTCPDEDVCVWRSGR